MEYTTYESKEAALQSLEGGLIEIADGDDKGRFAVEFNDNIIFVIVVRSFGVCSHPVA